MFKKLLSLMLAILIINLGLAQTVAAHTNPEKEAKFAEKVKAGIAKLGTGTDARVGIVVVAIIFVATVLEAGA